MTVIYDKGTTFVNKILCRWSLLSTILNAVQFWKAWPRSQGTPIRGAKTQGRAACTALINERLFISIRSLVFLELVIVEIVDQRRFIKFTGFPKIGVIKSAARCEAQTVTHPIGPFPIGMRRFVAGL